MSRRLVLLALAQKDILETEDYYGSISEQLADRFSNDLERTIEVLIRYPERVPGNGERIPSGTVG